MKFHEIAQLLKKPFGAQYNQPSFIKFLFECLSTNEFHIGVELCRSMYRGVRPISEENTGLLLNGIRGKDDIAKLLPYATDTALEALKNELLRLIATLNDEQIKEYDLSKDADVYHLILQSIQYCLYNPEPIIMEPNVQEPIAPEPTEPQSVDPEPITPESDLPEIDSVIPVSAEDDIADNVTADDTIEPIDIADVNPDATTDVEAQQDSIPSIDFAEKKRPIWKPVYTIIIIITLLTTATSIILLCIPTDEPLTVIDINVTDYSAIGADTDAYVTGTVTVQNGSIDDYAVTAAVYNKNALYGPKPNAEFAKVDITAVPTIGDADVSVGNFTLVFSPRGGPDVSATEIHLFVIDADFFPTQDVDRTIANALVIEVVTR